MPAQAAPQPLESPAVRRSRYLSELLTQTRQAPPQIQSGGELAARLLAQGLAQFGANRADRAVQEETTQRNQQAATGLGSTLDRLLGVTSQEGASLVAPKASPIAAEGPGNTLTPVQSPIAPIAPIQGAEIPPVGQAPPSQAASMAPQAPAPQAPANPLGPTPGEAAWIRAAATSGDPARVAEASALAAEIEQRMIAPPDYELRNVNGVEFMIDPRTGQRRQVFDEGVPEVARRQVMTAEPGNPYGLPEGTGFTESPDGTVTVVGTPQQGYVRRDGRLLPEEGGKEDVGGNPLLTFNLIRDVRGEIRPIIDQARQLQRNIAAVRAGIRAQNGAGDIAIINGVQKMIDEGVVREGDVALQLQAQGLEGGIAGLQGYLTSRGPFSPEIRAQLSRVAEDLYTSSNSAFQEQVMGYRPMVERRLGEGTFEDVVPSSTARAFGWLPAEANAAPAPRPQARPQTSAPAARSAQAAPSRPAPRPNGVTRRYNPNTGRIE